MYGPVHFRFMSQTLLLMAGRELSRGYQGKIMKKLIVAACIAALASALSGCIIYVSPDHHIHHSPHYDEKPAPTDEKPAPTA